MLQQTRVETVERYWDGFLNRFPSVGALAAADEASVLSVWSGLGYYRRARLLHQGAKYVHEQLRGSLPADGSALRKIPGIGRYTAGAIAAIAFDRPEPLVDGNVARVLSRVCGIMDAKAQLATASSHWSLVEAILAHGSPRVLAQALMELGATVCTPRSPDCRACPVRRHCQAKRRGLVTVIPTARKRAEKPEETLWAFAVLWRERLLLVQRPSTGLLAGLWCLPLAAADEGTPVVDAARAALGVDPVEDPVPLTPIDHVFTHRVWHLHPWQIRVARKPFLSNPHVWMRAGRLPEGGIPSVTRKLILGSALPARRRPGSRSITNERGAASREAKPARAPR
jgi:A/G-specific adenine glycosylase